VSTLVPLLLTLNASQICRRRRLEASEVPRMASSCHILGRRGLHSYTHRSYCQESSKSSIIVLLYLCRYPFCWYCLFCCNPCLLLQLPFYPSRCCCRLLVI
ncbi:unnamed protein product, partial [Ectocarpus sp. 4 AP-2014]